MKITKMTDIRMENYKEHLEIDRLALDEELIRQPILYASYAEMYPTALRERDEAKANKERCYAELDAEIRLDAATLGKKITEPAIENTIKQDERYQKAEQRYIDTNAAAAKIAVMKTAFEQRKDMLEFLIRLHLSGYFSEVKQDYGTKEVKDFELDSSIDEISKKTKGVHKE